MISFVEIEMSVCVCMCTFENDSELFQNNTFAVVEIRKVVVQSSDLFMHTCIVTVFI